LVPYVPAAQEPSQGLFCPTVLSKEPIGHAWQVFDDEAPLVLDHLPAAQFVQVLDEDAPVAEE